jgi:hypothetical protein
MRLNPDTLSHDVEYLAMLDVYAAADLAEMKQDDARAWEYDDGNEDSEHTAAWSYAFERNDEAREEMEFQDRLGFT